MFSLITQSESSYNLIFPGGICRERLRSDESLWSKCASWQRKQGTMNCGDYCCICLIHSTFSTVIYSEPPGVSVVNALLRVSCRTLTVTHFQFLYCSFALLSAATIEPPSQNQDHVSYIFNMGNGNDWPLCGVIGYG